MRLDRIIALLLFLIGCKGTSVVTQPEDYSEDLTAYRPVVEQPIVENEIIDTVRVDATELSGHINAELDSINRIIVERNKSKKWDGYTVQVYNGPSRQQAQETQETIRDLYPDMKPEMTYYRPSYRVKVGKFFDRLEANRFYTEMKGYFREAILLPEKLPIDSSDE